MMHHVIICPHADDEIIGCYSILRNRASIILLFHATAVSEGFEKYKKSDFDIHLIDTYDNVEKYINKTNFLYFPDPTYEYHPLHKEIGSFGGGVARKNIYPVLFYTTNMNVPYLRENPYYQEKQQILNFLYPEKSDLWKYDHKYFLFEGRCQWQNID